MPVVYSFVRASGLYSSNGPSFTRSNTSLLAIVQALAHGVYARDKGAYKDRIRAFKLK